MISLGAHGGDVSVTGGAPESSTGSLRKALSRAGGEGGAPRSVVNLEASGVFVGVLGYLKGESPLQCQAHG